MGSLRAREHQIYTKYKVAVSNSSPAPWDVAAASVGYLSMPYSSGKPLLLWYQHSSWSERASVSHSLATRVLPLPYAPEHPTARENPEVKLAHTSLLPCRAGVAHWIGFTFKCWKMFLRSVPSCNVIWWPDKLVSEGSVQCWKASCCLLAQPASGVPCCGSFNGSVAYRASHVLHTRGCIAEY